MMVGLLTWAQIGEARFKLLVTTCARAWCNQSIDKQKVYCVAGSCRSLFLPFSYTLFKLLQLPNHDCLFSFKKNHYPERNEIVSPLPTDFGLYTFIFITVIQILAVLPH